MALNNRGGVVMFCKNCGTENSDSSLRCSKCNAYLKSSDSPLDGTGRVKVVSYFVLLCMLLFFGIIPLIVSFVAIYLMKKDKSFKAIENSRKFLYGYLAFVGIVYFVVSIGKGEPVILLLSVACLIFPLIENYLFYKPLEEHQNWIIQYGIFADKPNEQSLLDVTKEKIQAFQKPQSCNVADELLKWKSLLDQGVITQEEFNKLKTKLMNGEKA